MMRRPIGDHRVDDHHRTIVLASGSPRRLELMESLGFRCDVRVSELVEQRHAGESPTAYTRRLASAKAREVCERLGADESSPHWILAADTIVVVGDEVFEKPVDRRQAADMLRRLSGSQHRVETSFCWLHRPTDQSSVRSVAARVQFRALSDDMISRYIATEEPFDKAGGYGIQDLGSTFVRSIDGSYFTIVGLPVCEVVEELQTLDGLAEFPFLQSTAT